MDIFEFRNALVGDYAQYISSFITIRDEAIKGKVEESFSNGLLWPDPLIQLNPAFERGGLIDELVGDGTLHPECSKIFRADKSGENVGRPLQLHWHQKAAIQAASEGKNYVLTTGTGSGKSLSYIVPIVDYVLRNGSGKGIQAIVVYPMNALANSQWNELRKFLYEGYGDRPPVTFERYTGQEKGAERDKIQSTPPDILLTNYVMLEYILTRPDESRLVQAAQDLKFLVLDELHTYRGRQGSDVAFLVRRVREALNAERMRCIGTSATMSTGGTLAEQQAQVSQVASLLFGTAVQPEDVIGERLDRSTARTDEMAPPFLNALKECIESSRLGSTADFDAFKIDPLATWVETYFGLEVELQTNRLKRRSPRGLRGESGAAEALSKLTGINVDFCERAIKDTLLLGYNQRRPDNGLPAFAFRLHQFISRGDTVYASPEYETDRYITINGQIFVPGSNQERILVPLIFCRECGQEYYSVRAKWSGKNGPKDGHLQSFSARPVDNWLDNEEDGEAGYLYIRQDNPWPVDRDQLPRHLPEDWVEEFNGKFRVRKDREKHLPIPVKVAPSGAAGDGADCHYISGTFRFCMCCEIDYGVQRGSDFAKLSSLSSEGRSTATTLLSLSAVRKLKKSDVKQEAKKLLSFTDNRQDASLQSGHFNDFVEIGLIRSALYQAVDAAGDGGLEYDRLTERVFHALSLPLKYYAVNSEVRHGALRETHRAMQNVLGYRLYRDLRRGWRVTSPNLEQCGLLEIHYDSLDDVCADEAFWQRTPDHSVEQPEQRRNGQNNEIMVDVHESLSQAPPEKRQEVVKTLLDYMRRELAIKVDYLEPDVQERIKAQSSQNLISPWTIDENESMEPGKIAYPGSRPKGEPGVYISGFGGFGRYLRRPSIFQTLPSGGRLKVDQTGQIIQQLLAILAEAGLIERVVSVDKRHKTPGYQLLARTILWTTGDGTRAFHDPIRVPNPPEDGRRTNPFFVDFYRNSAAELVGLEAREHTAQVPYEEREKRENQFKNADLPILYCSPTMELGVDIASLNVVNMRNMPPTPANYAQRSGRAGRSGQPALVFTYCSTGNNHDQYFFKRPENMVSGIVTAPRLDLTNEDLIRAHVHSIWLAQTGLNLQRSLSDILNIEGENPTLTIKDDVRVKIENPQAKQIAYKAAERVLDGITDQLSEADWYRPNWLQTVMSEITARFDKSCDRWRDLYHAAREQVKAQNKIILQAGLPPRDLDAAKRLRHDAEQQMQLLIQVDNVAQSDFYSYRYFASEGFLPGYNFPRLPLSAFIPARKGNSSEAFVSRPRFLAISEFGPRSVIYHEGSRYIINKVILPVSKSDNDQQTDLITQSAKLCGVCGYLHPGNLGAIYNTCQQCGRPLESELASLFRLQNVSTRRRERINCDEEERLRLGYDIVTGVRFKEHDGVRSCRTAAVMPSGAGSGSGESDEKPLATLTYSQSATLWRINQGERRRKNKARLGFNLDIQRGYWQKSEQEAGDPDDPMSPRTQWVVPFVEDTRNALLIAPSQDGIPFMYSLQAALKNAIQIEYQMEDSELAVELLPNRNQPVQILLYESAEGGAGVLRRIIDERNTKPLAQIARQALELCHFDPDTGEDRLHALRSKEECAAACYDCLMSYSNQRDHEALDRHKIKDYLLQLVDSSTIIASQKITPGDDITAASDPAAAQPPIAKSADSITARWLDFMKQRGYRLPSPVGTRFDGIAASPDFVYRTDFIACAVYIDGSPAEFPDRQERDRDAEDDFDDRGIKVIRFAGEKHWEAICELDGHIFGAS